MPRGGGSPKEVLQGRTRSFLLHRPRGEIPTRHRSRKSLSHDGDVTAMGTPRGGGISVLGGGQDSAGHSPGQPGPALKLSPLGAGVGPSPPTPFNQGYSRG